LFVCVFHIVVDTTIKAVDDSSLLPLPWQFASLDLKDLSTVLPSISVDKTSEHFHHLLHAGMFARSGIRRVVAAVE
jgi:hypothetical protein